MVLSFKKALLAAMKEAKAAEKSVEAPTVQAAPTRSEPAKTVVARQVAGSRDSLSPKADGRTSPVTECVGTQADALRRTSPQQVSKPILQVKPCVSVICEDSAVLAWRPEDASRLVPIAYDQDLGSRLHPPDAQPVDARELIIGLDFGTSCAKVVITDREMQHAYAVPMVDATGVNAYLLPARLNEVDGVYTLDDKGVAHTDLKLALMATPTDEVLCARVCAYLALVIRAARSWLFTQHKEQYQRADILWSLALGQPADQATSGESKKLFESIAKIAWILAGQSGPVGVREAYDQWRTRQELSVDDELEVLVMPELAAQIHGFVSSSNFDRRSANIFLMVDVGAGTVDASTFHVRKDASGTTSFGFFTSSVEAYGAANMHRNRVTWWQSNLCSHENGRKLAEELESIKLSTEYRGIFPDVYTDYFKGVSATLSLTPDDDFFNKVRAQVVGQVLIKAWKNNLLSKQAIEGIPLFICGGGSRHVFYRNILKTLKRTHGASWLRAEYRELMLPSGLIAPGLNRSDYDRLSVAYGLSQLTPGKIVQAEAMAPIVKVDRMSDWSENYVDNSSC